MMLSKADIHKIPLSQGLPDGCSLELLTTDAKWSGWLAYRDRSTGTLYRVPNIWYNQPIQNEIDRLRWHGTRANEQATKWMHSRETPDRYWVSNMRDLGDRLLAKADFIEAYIAGEQIDPQTPASYLIHILSPK